MSKMWRPRFDAGVSDWFIMSSVVGSTPCAMTTWAAGGAAGRRPPPRDAGGWGAGRGGGVRQRERQRIRGVRAQAAIEAVARAGGQPLRGAEVQRARVVAHEPFEHADRPRGQAQPL